MKLNITLIGVNFYPEDTAIGLYSTQMVQFLEAKGYSINVVTGFPYYPQWEIHGDYEAKSRFFEESLGQIRILRYKQYVPKKPSFFKRVIHLLDFTLGSFRNLAKIKTTDLIICIVPFTSSILLGWWLKKRTKAKLWIHIQDFEFDAAIQSGLSAKKSTLKELIFKFLFWTEKILLSKANVNSSISHIMVQKLMAKSKTPAIYFPNWIDIDKINPKTSKQHPYLNSNKFKILYSGNVGDKQDWELFIQLALKLSEFTELELTVVGDGAKYEWLIEQLRFNPIVRFYKPVPYEELSSLLCSADLHILIQKTEVLDTVMPSKLLGMMASGKPSIITGNSASEVKRIINESKGGIYLDENEASTLTRFIMDLKTDKKRAQNLGLNARNFIIKNFSKKAILSDFEKKIKELI